jgi:hypothetical protein
MKYQLHKVTVPIQAGGVYTDVAISVDTDKLYKTVKQMWIYSDTNVASNKNLVVTGPIKVNSVEVYPENFDTNLLFPKEDNIMLGTLDVNEPAGGSRVEGKIQYQANIAAAFDVKIVLVLSDE